jgi:chromosome segregation protein
MILDLVNLDGEFKEVAGQLLENVLVVEDLEQALQVWRAQKKPRTVVTLDGEVVDPLGLVTGGSLETQGASVLAQKREIRELQDLCEELQVHHDELHERLVDSKQEVVRVQSEEEELRRAIHEADMTLLGLSKDLDAARSRLDGFEGRLVGARQEAGRLRETLATLEQHRAGCAGDLARLVDEQTVSREQMELGLQAAGADRLRVDTLASEVGDLTVTGARAAEQRNTSERELARLGSDLETDRQRLVTLTESAALSTERVRTLQEEVGVADDERLAVSSQAMDLGEKLSAESEVCERWRAELDELEASLKQFRDERRTLSEQRENAKMSLLELAKDWEHLADRLVERHHVTTQEVLHDFHLRPVFDEEFETRLAKQTKILESLRITYHPGARQEYEELAERHDFLSEQKQDLEDALERLDKAIQKINRTSRARFRAAFEGINKQFQVVYPRLFKGGKAWLELTQSGDVLNAGVDIIARPPGKKLQSVDLLSGGEKALTAVALLFAIFRYKPSPFCLLDEVDAPLDDINVDRFNEIVREMAGDTQFIIITHNKRTMALSESLYGVTMEQAGCSKVVQVSFREARDMVDDDGPGGFTPPPDPATDPDPTRGEGEVVTDAPGDPSSMARPKPPSSATA